VASLPRVSASPAAEALQLEGILLSLPGFSSSVFQTSFFSAFSRRSYFTTAKEKRGTTSLAGL
jgi:UPF0716 family protein affecting phage T7 exclusion